MYTNIENIADTGTAHLHTYKQIALIYGYRTRTWAHLQVYAPHTYVSTYVHPPETITLFCFIFFDLKLAYVFYSLVYYLCLSLEYKLHDNNVLVRLVHCYIPSNKIRYPE